MFFVDLAELEAGVFGGCRLVAGDRRPSAPCFMTHVKPKGRIRVTFLACHAVDANANSLSTQLYSDGSRGAYSPRH